MAPGDRVKHKSTKECGIVVHVWDDAGAEDCYVAFFGFEFPSLTAEPTQKPYVLRYYATSLEPA